MNYDANATHWQIGDLVIHDCDAKEPRMLMVVIGYTPDGLCKTRYAAPWMPRTHRTIYRNEPKYLHDPRRFGIAVPEKATANEQT
jgi:hypothetical protein